MSNVYFYEEQNKLYPPKPCYQFKLSPLWALFAVVLFMVLLIPTVSAQTGIIAGVKSTYWDRYVHVGSITKLSNRVSIYGTIEVGGGEYNIKPLSVLTFPVGKYLTLGFILGADIQIYQPYPTAEETITYLSSTTGILALLKMNNEFSLIGSLEYRQNDAVMNNTRFGIGAVFWLPQ